VLKSISINFLPMKEIRKPLKRKGGGFNIYGSEGPEYVDLQRALRDPVEIWSIDAVVQANAELAVEAMERFMKYFDLFVDLQRFIDQHPIEEYFGDTGDSDVPWSFNSTRWMMDGVKIYNDLVYVDVEYDHDGVEYDHEGKRKYILSYCVEGCFAILQNQAMYIFGSTLGRHFYPDHEFAFEVDPAVTLDATPHPRLGRYPCRLRY